MAGSSLELGRALRSYVAGFVLASLLTAVPFGLVAARALEGGPTLAAIAVLAIVQIAVHLRYFLHVDLKPSSHPALLMLTFAAVLIFIMVGGSLDPLRKSADGWDRRGGCAAGCGSSGLKAGLEVEDAGDDADRGVVGRADA